MFKMKKLASIAAAAAMTATAMTGLVSTASAAEEVDMMFLPKGSECAVEFEGRDKGAGNIGKNSEDFTFKDITYTTYKTNYLGAKDSTELYGIPTLTVNDLSAGTYSLYYIGGNGYDSSHSIENIEFIENDSNVITPHIKKANIEKLDGSHYAHGYQITFDEDFSGKIKFVNTNTWLPDLYGIELTNKYSFDFGSVGYGENNAKLSLGKNSIALTNQGFVKDDGTTDYLDVVEKKALLTYPDIDLTGKRLTKATISMGTTENVTIALKVGDTVIGKVSDYNNGTWTIGNENIVFEGLDLENLKGNVTVDITKDSNYCGNYGAVTFYYDDIETPEPSCTYTIDVPAEKDDNGESATGVRATVNLNGSSTNSFKWTITKDDKEMHADYSSTEFTGGNTEFVIGLVVPMEVTSKDDAASKITFSAE